MSHPNSIPVPCRTSGAQATIPGVSAIQKLSHHYSLVAFEVFRHGFVAYVNHQPVAWALKGILVSNMDGTPKRCKFVDVAYLAVNTPKSRHMDQKTFETYPSNATHDEAMDFLLSQARDFVINMFGGKAVGGEV